MLSSIILNYIFGLLLSVTGRHSRFIVVLCIISNLSILVYFKYLSFITENIKFFFKSEIKVPNIALPIGISFFTFQAISYILDVFNKKAEAQKNPLDMALYISMFPQLTAGPIVRYETFAEAVKSRVSTAEGFSEGAILFVYGFAKKIIIANSMGKIADNIFSLSDGYLTGKTAWIGVLAYAFQIFYDFSGYSDMALGLGKIFGFTFHENFNFPYICKSITEFWRRWHISLSAWFRDYVYIPLRGNRCGRFRNLLNIGNLRKLTKILPKPIKRA